MLQEPQGPAKNSTSAETAKEVAKEKGGPSSLPLGKLFWKKVSSSLQIRGVPGARMTGEVVSGWLATVFNDAWSFFFKLTQLTTELKTCNSLQEKNAMSLVLQACLLWERKGNEHVEFSLMTPVRDRGPWSSVSRLLSSMGGSSGFFPPWRRGPPRHAPSLLPRDLALPLENHSRQPVPHQGRHKARPARGTRKQPAAFSL